MTDRSISRAICVLGGPIHNDWTVSYGVDASLRHGSIQQIKRLENHHYSFSEVFYWHSKGPSLSEKSTLSEIGQFATSITGTLLNLELGPVLIEFDPRSVYWRSGKLQIVTMAVFLGYLVGFLHSVGYPALSVSPRESRQFYGFTQGKKEEFHNHFLNLATHCTFTPNLSPDLIGSDQLDALLVGLMLWPDDWRQFVGEI